MAYIKKVYPIEGRKDFYKYVIIENKQLCKDYRKKEMYFDCIEQAKMVCDARNRVKRINKQYLNS